jgi:hypothetical protein
MHKEFAKNGALYIIDASRTLLTRGQYPEVKDKK